MKKCKEICYLNISYTEGTDIMNRRVKKISATLAVVLLLNNGAAIAEPLSEELQVKEQQLQKEKNEFESIRDRREDMEIEIERFDARIEEIMRKIDSNKKEISTTENNIESIEEEIVRLQEDLQKEQELFNKRMRTLYMNGSIGYLDILLSVSSIGDFIDKVETVTTIIKYDKKMRKNLNDMKIKIELQKEQLYVRKENLIAVVQDNQKQLSKLNENKNDQQELLNKIKHEETHMASSIQQTQNYINEIKRNMELGNNRPSRGDSDVSGNAVIAYASNFLGIPYLWGGTSPQTGFDCSGFTQYVYAHFGITVGRTTYDQIKDGIPVSKSNLQPGDLVFFGTWSNPHHIGIYVGNNNYIHSPRTGDVLKISPMTRRDFVTGRRVIY
jgi:cell wall-associated NlpC family hydrolase